MALVEILPLDQHGRLIELAGASVELDSEINGNDASGNRNSQLIPVERLRRSFVWSVNWKRSVGAPVLHVGIFRLDLQRLLDGGYIRRESASHVRLNVFHVGSRLSIQRNRGVRESVPELPFARIVLD